MYIVPTVRTLQRCIVRSSSTRNVPLFKEFCFELRMEISKTSNCKQLPSGSTAPLSSPFEYCNSWQRTTKCHIQKPASSLSSTYTSMSFWQGRSPWTKPKFHSRVASSKLLRVFFEKVNLKPQGHTERCPGIDAESTAKTLGIRWRAKSDEFYFVPPEIAVETSYTKREGSLGYSIPE